MLIFNIMYSDKMGDLQSFSLVVVGVLLLQCIALSDGARILSIAYPGRSQLGLSQAVLGELKNRGHEVWMLFGDTFEIPDSLRDSRINLLTFKARDEILTDKLEIQKNAFMAATENPESRTDIFHLISAIETASNLFSGYLEDMFLDKELDKQVRELKFDLIIVYGYWFFAKAYLFPHRYAVPYVSVVFDMQQLAGVPLLPSFVPSLAITATCSDNMSFSQRLLNIIPYMLLKQSVQEISPEFTQKHAPGRPHVSTTDLMAESELWIVDGGQPAIDYPKPSLPNVKYLGGLITKPAKPLPKDLEEFLNTHKQGVVLVTFGGLVKYLPENFIQKLDATFRKIPYGVLWKYNARPLKDLPKRVKIMTWMPQNDILAHPNIKLFITHAGNNGQMESLYHGVPMISMPLFGDQDYNAARAQHKGIAITIDPGTFETEELVSAIDMVMANKSIADNMQKASAAFRDQPSTPGQEAAYWIEHVIKHGGSYMKSHARLLPWYQFYMVDAILLLSAVVLLVFVCCGSCCYFVSKKLCSSTVAKVKQKTK